MIRFSITQRQEFFMQRLLDAFEDANNSENYESEKKWWNTIFKDLFYSFNSTGINTGLISVEAYKTKDYDGSGQTTYEHVYSNVKCANWLFDEWKKGNVDLDYLKENVQYLVPTIVTTKDENHKLSKVTDNMSFSDIREMKHYKEMGIKLMWNPKQPQKIYGNVTNAMKELIVTTNDFF